MATCKFLWIILRFSIPLYFNYRLRWFLTSKILHFFTLNRIRPQPQYDIIPVSISSYYLLNYSLIV